MKLKIIVEDDAASAELKAGNGEGTGNGYGTSKGEGIGKGSGLGGDHEFLHEFSSDTGEGDRDVYIYEAYF